MYRNIILAGVVMSVLVGCGIPAIKPLPTHPKQNQTQSQPSDDPPEWFPLAQFVKDIGDGRSHTAAQKPYQGRTYLLRLRVDDFTRDGYAVCSFVGGGAEPVATIKLPDGAKKGDVVGVVGIFRQYGPGGVVIPSQIAFSYVRSVEAGGK